MRIKCGIQSKNRNPDDFNTWDDILRDQTLQAQLGFSENSQLKDTATGRTLIGKVDASVEEIDIVPRGSTKG